MIKGFIEVTARDDNYKYLTTNTCIYGNCKEDFDYDANLETLKRLAKEYHIKFDESIFY